jgi:hypothetical protein
MDVRNFLITKTKNYSRSAGFTFDNIFELLYFNATLSTVFLHSMKLNKKK